jgi:beta-xylosidase
MIEPKGVIIDEKNMRTVPFMNNDYLNHFKNEKLCSSIKNIFDPLNADTRMDTYQSTKENLEGTIQLELNLLLNSIH